MQTALFLQISVAFMALVEPCEVAVGNTQTRVDESHPRWITTNTKFKKWLKDKLVLSALYIMAKNTFNAGLK